MHYSSSFLYPLEEKANEDVAVDVKALSVGEQC